jgi:hypothetical protein
MFPSFKNDANGTPVLYFTAAGSVPFGAATVDGTTLSVPDGVAMIAAYEADGAAVALSEFTFPIVPTATGFDTVTDTTAADGTIGTELATLVDSSGLAIVEFQFTDGTAAFSRVVSDNYGNLDYGDVLTFSLYGVGIDTTVGEISAAVSSRTGTYGLTWTDAGGATNFPVRAEFSASSVGQSPVIDGTRGINNEIQLAPVANVSPITVIPTVGGDGTTGVADYNPQSDVNRPDELSPYDPDGNYETSETTAPSLGDASSPAVVPSDLDPKATKRWN